MTTQPSDWAVPYCIVERLAAAKDHFPVGTDERKAVWEAIEYFLRLSARELDASATTNSAQISSSLVVGDTERLDWIERTYSGMTNRERYLPVQMIWGKGANGRTLREAIDKYMRKETPFTGVTFVERDMPPGVIAEVRTRHDRVTIVKPDDDAAMGAVGAGGGE